MYGDGRGGAVMDGDGRPLEVDDENRGVNIYVFLFIKNNYYFVEFSSIFTSPLRTSRGMNLVKFVIFSQVGE